MNECLTTPQHEKQIGYNWVSEQGKMHEMVISVKSCAILVHYKYIH